MTSILPYWDQNIDLDIVPWLPYGMDYSPRLRQQDDQSSTGEFSGAGF